MPPGAATARSALRPSAVRDEALPATSRFASFLLPFLGRRRRIVRGGNTLLEHYRARLPLVRKLDPPDWGYFAAAWGIVAVGLGMVLMGSDSEALRFAGLALAVLGILLLLYSLRPTIRSLFRPAHPSLDEVFGPGLELVFTQHVHDEVRGRQAYLHQYKIRIKKTAKVVRFECRDPLHSVGIPRLREPNPMASSSDRPDPRQPRSNWAEFVFSDPETARGSLLIAELSSITPLKLERVEIIN